MRKPTGRTGLNRDHVPGSAAGGSEARLVAKGLLFYCLFKSQKRAEKTMYVTNDICMYLSQQM